METDTLYYDAGHRSDLPLTDSHYESVVGRACAALGYFLLFLLKIKPWNPAFSAEVNTLWSYEDSTVCADKAIKRSTLDRLGPESAVEFTRLDHNNKRFGIDSQNTFIQIILIFALRQNLHHDPVAITALPDP